MSARLKKPLTNAQLRKKYKNLVPVPKSSAQAYNPGRAVGGLVTHQLQHLQFAMQALPGWHRAGMKSADVKTEGEAAAFVSRATEVLHRVNKPQASATLARPRRRRPAAPARRLKKAVTRRRKKRGRRA